MDSDDYFDDIVLDDQTLAVLDSVEQNFLTQTVPPPAKRQKTDKGWKPVPAQGRAPVVDDNDLPEISVHGDGTYGLGESNSTLNPPTVQSSHQRVASVPTVPRVAPHTRPEPPPRPRDSFPQSTTRNRAYQAPHERVPQQVVASDISQAEELRKQLEEVCRVHSSVFIVFNVSLASKGESEISS
ncbi:hypothetical protein B0H13DRAFT_1976686 [Mycena leptocephala]|jgi:hypothetical protein|nr:hypothetical protein B0H13DRAFT_1976686 [Mycena leptocephala]